MHVLYITWLERKQQGHVHKRLSDVCVFVCVLRIPSEIYHRLFRSIFVKLCVRTPTDCDSTCGVLSISNNNIWHRTRMEWNGMLSPDSKCACSESEQTTDCTCTFTFTFTAQTHTNTPPLASIYSSTLCTIARQISSHISRTFTNTTNKEQHNTQKCKQMARGVISARNVLQDGGLTALAVYYNEVCIYFRHYWCSV